MNLETILIMRKLIRKEKEKAKKQLKKDIAAANKHFLTNLFKTLNDE